MKGSIFVESITEKKINSNEISYNINKHTEDFFQDFCPNTANTIDCSQIGGIIQLTDGFYGVSNVSPPVCVYK